MKKYFILFVLVILLASCGSSNSVKEKNIKRTLPIAVEELTLPSGFDSEYVTAVKSQKTMKIVKPLLRIMRFDIPNSFLAAINDYEFKMDEQLKAEFAKTERFTVLGNDSDIAAVFEEQKKLGYDEFASEDATIEMGNLKIAGYTVVGKITQSYPDIKQIGGYFLLKVAVEVAITVTNANTGVVEFTNVIKSEREEKLFVSAEGVIIQGPRNLTNREINSIGATGKDIDLSPQYRDALTESTHAIVNYIEEKIPIMGEVIGLNMDEVISTASSLNGLKPGDYIFIVRVGDALKNSAGKIMGYSKSVIGAAQVKSVEKSMSTAKIIKLKDETVFPINGDFVISIPNK